MLAGGSGRRQPRLVTPLKSRIRRGYRGDTLVALSRGLAGKRAVHKEIVSDLGLTRWGDQCLGFSSDDKFIGKAQRVDHLVTITRLGRVMDLVDLERASRRRPTIEAEALMVSEGSGPYEVGKTRGWFQRLAHDEYIHAERQSNGTHSIMWSTTMNWDEFLSEALDHVPDLGTFGSAHWQHVDFDDESSGSTRDLLRLRKQGDVQLAYCGAEVADAIYFWRRPFLKLKAFKAPSAEGAIVFGPAADIDDRRVRELMTKTGSPNVQRLLEGKPDLVDVAVAAAS
jgi:ribosomal protein L30/L7E